jgi:hypothetical protein
MKADFEKTARNAKSTPKNSPKQSTFSAGASSQTPRSVISNDAPMWPNALETRRFVICIQ